MRQKLRIYSFLSKVQTFNNESSHILSYVLSKHLDQIASNSLFVVLSVFPLLCDVNEPQGNFKSILFVRLS